MTARTALELVVLALAAARTTTFLVTDLLPFGALREAIWRRWPPPDPVNELPGSAFGYLWTCTSCMSVWATAGWLAAWWVWPRATIVVAAPFAVMALARTVAGHR